MSDADDKRKAKRGSLKVTEAERVAADAARWAADPAACQLTLGLLKAGGELLPDDDKAAVPATGKQGGRPVGARATAPLEYRRFILATKGDFLGRFASLAMADTIQLARLLGCSPYEALQLQQKLGATAAPYVYAPQKAPLDQEDRDYYAGLVFAAGAISAPAAKGMLDAVAALAGRPVEVEQLQPFIEGETVASEPAHSEPADDDEDKAP